MRSLAAYQKQWVSNILTKAEQRDADYEKLANWLLSQIMGSLYDPDHSMFDKIREGYETASDTIANDAMAKKKKIDKAGQKKIWKDYVAEVNTLLKEDIKAEESSEEDDFVMRNAVELKNILNLTEAELSILLFMGSRDDLDLDRANAGLLSTSGAKAGTDIFAIALGLPRKDVDEAFKPTSILIKGGLLWFSGADDDEFQGSSYSLVRRGANTHYSVNGRILAALNRPSAERDEMIEALIGKRLHTRLTLQDVSHIRSTMNNIVGFVAGGLNDTEGVGKIFCVYGPTGTGKTEGMALVGTILDIPVFSVGLSAIGEEGQMGEPDRRERFAQVRLADAIVKATSIRALLVADEADDMLTDIQKDKSGRSKDASKGHIADKMTSLSSVIAFVTNDPQVMNDAIVRRLTPFYEFPLPPRDRRQAIINRYASERQLGLDSKFEENLARDFPELSPGHIANIFRAVGYVAAHDGKLDAREKQDLVLSHFTQTRVAMNDGYNPVPDPTFNPSSFNPNLFNASTNVSKLMDRLKTRDRMHLLIIGPEGSGKRTIAHWFAHSRDLHVVPAPAEAILAQPERTDPLVDMMMRRAILDKSLLLFETNGSLGKVQNLSAHPLIKRLQEHKQPVIFTSTDGLLGWDVLRNFPYVLNLEHLEEKQIREAHKWFFGCEVDNRLLALPDNGTVFGYNSLTPSQFSVIRQRFNDGEKITTEKVYDEFVDYLEAASPQRGAGFHTNWREKRAES